MKKKKTDFIWRKKNQKLLREKGLSLFWWLPLKQKILNSKNYNSRMKINDQNEAFFSGTAWLSLLAMDSIDDNHIPCVTRISKKVMYSLLNVTYLNLTVIIDFDNGLYVYSLFLVTFNVRILRICSKSVCSIIISVYWWGRKIYINTYRQTTGCAERKRKDRYG